MGKSVAIILERANVTLGGAERSMFETAGALAARGLKVDLLAAKGKTALRNIHVLCADVPGKRVRLAVFRDALQRHLAQHRYDIVHSVLPFDFVDVYQPRGGTYAETIIRHAASYPNAAVRWFKRTTAFTNRRRAGLLEAERRLCNGSHGPIVAALSHYVADQLKGHYGTDPSRIALVPNGVKTDRQINPKTADRLRSQVFAELGIHPEDPAVLFLFVAHNFRLKGLGRLIHALHVAEQAGMDRPACLIVAGADRREPYRRLARRLGVEKRIIFLGAVKRIQNALSVVDVAVLPTFYDPSSRFILEALAAGKPVVTTRFNGAADHFVHDRHGTVIDAPDNIGALAEAIRHFAVPGNVESAARAIRNDKLKEKISIRRVAKDLLQVYDSVWHKKGRP